MAIKVQLVPKLKLYSTGILHIPYKIFEQKHLAWAKRYAKILKHGVYTCLNVYLKEIYITVLKYFAISLCCYME